MVRPPSARSPSSPLIFVIVGSSGAGKGSIATALAARVPNLWLSRSWTSRPRRVNEAPDAYTFVDTETFRDRVERGGFIEWAEVFGHLYGTPDPEPPSGFDILLEIDVQGAGQVRDHHPDAVVILIEPPSREVQEARLRARGDEPAVIARRLARADAEEATARALADHRVVNDELNRAVDEAAAIVEAHRRESRRAN